MFVYKLTLVQQVYAVGGGGGGGLTRILARLRFGGEDLVVGGACGERYGSALKSYCSLRLTVSWFVLIRDTTRRHKWLVCRLFRVAAR